MDLVWKIWESAPASHFARFGHFPRPIAQLLYNRNIRTTDAADAFLARRAPGAQPFHLLGMTEAVDRIRHAIAGGERILVYGDYDADGITSTVVMLEGLHALGARAHYYIPDRVEEGYGLNPAAIHNMARNGYTLLITVDCGIRGNDEVALAQSLGIDVIVTDHHSVPDPLPVARAIINPKQATCPYPYKMVCGVGIAWKTILALWLAERKRPVGRARVNESWHPRELLPFVALGTVADVVPLVGENRQLVWEGLQALRTTAHPGLLALMESAGVAPADVDAEKIAFFLAPRLNAAGRLGDPRVACNLLRSRDPRAAQEAARELKELNSRRQEMTSQAMARAAAQLHDPTAPILFISDDKCHQGIVGLVAGRLAEQYYRPTVVVAQGRQESRASCRSIPEFHITRALDQLSHLLLRHGGHAAAAGFSVATEKLPELERALTDLADRTLPDRTLLRPTLMVDAELPLHTIQPELMDALELLAPFGEQNPLPIWVARGVQVDSARQVGRDGSHLKLLLRDERGKGWGAIAFRQGARADTLPERVDIAFTLQRNEWNGRSRLELKLEDLQSAEERVPA